MESCDEDDEFFFESAHLALRSNSDYLRLVRHLSLLCSLRIKVHNDIDALKAAERNALEDPEGFVKELTQGTSNLPGQIEIPEIPVTDLLKYNVNIPSLASEQDNEPDQPTLTKQPHVNFWTLDEQRKLEELLNRFPPEAVESQRFKKIAIAMGGTRTPKQIASRVQKFFKKLQEENLPIPGTSSAKLNRNRRHRQNFRFEKASTFFPERNIPSDLVMHEESDEGESGCQPALDAPNKLELEKNDRVLFFLKQVRESKNCTTTTKLLSDSSENICSSCNEKLLLGTKWTCNECGSQNDLCSDCFTTQLLNGSYLHLYHDVQNS